MIPLATEKQVELIKILDKYAPARVYAMRETYGGLWSIPKSEAIELIRDLLNIQADVKAREKDYQ